MHEMALMESVREIVDATARRHRARRVAAVRLRIGAFAVVEPEALRFCFDVVMKGGPAERATLEIETVAASGWCWDCARSVTLAAHGARCPACGGERLAVRGGAEMQVHEIDLAEDEEVTPCA